MSVARAIRRSRRDARRTLRAEASRRGAPRRRARTACGHALWRLYRGDGIEGVLHLVHGGDLLGRDLTRRVLRACRMAGGDARKLAEYYVRGVLEQLRPHAAAAIDGRTRHWRATGRDAGVGVRTTYELVASTDQTTGEVVRSYVRRHRAAPRGVGAGGMAQRIERCPRTLDRYRRALRAAGVIGSQRTTRRMPDAVLPHAEAHHGYAQTWLVGEVPPTVLRGLAEYPPARVRGVLASALPEHRARGRRPHERPSAPVEPDDIPY